MMLSSSSARVTRRFWDNRQESCGNDVARIALLLQACHHVLVEPDEAKSMGSDGLPDSFVRGMSHNHIHVSLADLFIERRQPYTHVPPATAPGFDVGQRVAILPPDRMLML